METFAGLGARRRNELHNGVVQRFHRGGGIGQFHLGVALFGGAIDEGEIELLIGGVQGHEQFEHLVEDLLGIGVVAVNLVDDHDGLGAGFKGLAQHEAGLRLRTFGGIHHEQHAVDHVHDTFDFAAEIRVSGSIHNVDVVVLVFERGVLGADGDALFFFKVHRIHQAFHLGFGLVGAERAGLFEQAVHQGGLAVINVRDNSDVADMLHKLK